MKVSVNKKNRLEFHKLYHNVSPRVSEGPFPLPPPYGAIQCKRRWAGSRQPLPLLLLLQSSTDSRQVSSCWGGHRYNHTKQLSEGTRGCVALQGAKGSVPD